MGSIFHWIYCLDIPDAITLTILATACFLFLERRLSGRRWWKWLLTAGLLLWLGAVLYLTLATRDADGSRLLLPPFHSYFQAFSEGKRELLRSNFMNALLFFPAGLLAWALLPKSLSFPKKIALVAAAALLLSLSIEAIQYFRMLGLAEADDVIHNTLGAALAAACCIPYKRSDDHDPN